MVRVRVCVRVRVRVLVRFRVRIRFRVRVRVMVRVRVTGRVRARKNRDAKKSKLESKQHGTRWGTMGKRQTNRFVQVCGHTDRKELVPRPRKSGLRREIASSACVGREKKRKI
jgi:hypothetical protein